MFRALCSREICDWWVHPGVFDTREWTGDVLNLAFPEFVADGYNFVFQDIRGKFDSEGQFVMVRPPRDKRDAKSIDESTAAGTSSPASVATGMCQRMTPV